jgi:predicted metal-dependent hydrolase
MKNSILTDPQLGQILFRYNQRAKKYIIRIKASGISVTIPYGGNYKSAESFFNKNKNAIFQKRNELSTAKKEENSPKQDALLRQQAKEYLPKELVRLAQEYGFSFQAIRISKSKTRWGSCSSKGTVNLSFYIMLLPGHLIEYVLLHELCHTIEMNHSVKFWLLLDKYTNGKAKELRKELRNYHIPNP